VLGVVFASQVIGGVLAIGLALVRGEPVLDASSLGWAVLAGIAGPSGLVFFYRGLSVGRMGIVAPISGLLGAAIPVAVDAFTQGLPSTPQLIGIAVALLAMALVTKSDRAGASGSSGIGLAIIAGIGFGAFFVFIAQVGHGAVFWPLLVARVTASIGIGLLLLATRTSWRPNRRVAPLVLIAGVLDMGGNVWFLLATQQGRLDIAAVLTSLYPIVTALLAAMLLRERMGRVQALGIGAAVVAIVLIGAG
jgi:drug/metabolite transporter (DMT)-like permease